jgi:phage shock protein A
MSTVVKAKVSKLLDRAEDPAETLDYSYQKQVEQLQNVKKGIADVVTAKKRLQMQESTLQQQVVKLDTQARQALSSGQEDLARTALERKNIAQTELQSLDTQVHELEEQQQKLTDSEQKLRAKIEAFRTKKEVIKAQYSAAEAQVRISEAATGVGEQMADVGLAMQHRAGLRRRRHRPPAQAALQPVRRRRRSREAQERAGRGSSRGADPRLQRAGGAERGAGRRSGAERGWPGMIVRISGEDQYRLDEGSGGRLKELDDDVHAAIQSGEEQRFRDSYQRLLEFVRSSGQVVGDDELEGSDLILPPADLSLAEAASEFTGEGLIPD